MKNHEVNITFQHLMIFTRNKTRDIGRFVYDINFWSSNCRTVLWLNSHDWISSLLYLVPDNASWDKTKDRLFFLRRQQTAYEDSSMVENSQQTGNVFAVVPSISSLSVPMLHHVSLQWLSHRKSVSRLQLLDSGAIAWPMQGIYSGFFLFGHLVFVHFCCCCFVFVLFWFVLLFVFFLIKFMWLLPW